jgi:neutral ceramidase
MRTGATAFAFTAFLGLVAACGGGGDDADDDGDDTAVTTDHCAYEPVPATAGAGGTVAPGALTAGAADVVIDVPVGTALGGYTARANFLGTSGVVDTRRNQLSGDFNPTIGVFTAPRAKAVALTAGGETVVIIKLDTCFVYEGMLFDLEARLGAEFAGKVLLASSHTHSGWAQHSGHTALKLGGGELRDLVFQRVLGAAEQAAQQALNARRPARLGVHVDTDFDPTNQVNRDRRGDNDELMGGPRKDDRLYLVRVDGTDDQPIAALAVFGEHGTLSGEDNSLAANDAPGAAERQLEQRLPQGTVAIHLQSAGADTSPTPHGGLDCNLAPGDPDDPCFSGWVAEEGHGAVAAGVLHAAWQAASADMQTDLALEMLTRSVETGPYAATFSIREGGLTYAPHDLAREPDGIILDGSGNLVSPIDEFNAPVGAALCETADPMFPAAAIPGTEGVLPYGSCLRIDLAGDIFGAIFDFDFESSETRPLCQTTRTTISALRLGDFMIGTLPGEVSVMIADKVRAASPVPDDRTIVVGYAQGHVGYILQPEDWVRGGYEASISFNGPLEGEFLVERLAELMPLATTSEREDGGMGGATKLATARATDNFEIDDPAPLAGTVPDPVPVDTWMRAGTPTVAQPDPMVPRVSGLARFVWIGDDRLNRTPSVVLERQVGPQWVPVVRPSGAPVTDGEIVLSYTPQPLRREPGMAQTHIWAIEWQPVPAWGAVDLAGASNAALGATEETNYRFHVRGDGWEIASDPFAVVPGGIYASAVRSGTTGATVTVSFDAPRGYRALSLQMDSNRPVPMRGAQVLVRFRNGAGTTVGSGSGTTDVNGVVTVDGGAGVANAVSVEVEDPNGNTYVAMLN